MLSCPVPVLSCPVQSHGMTSEMRLGDGRYLARGVLGEGAQGTTYDAVDTQSGRAVAIKRFDVRGARSWKDVELAEREVRAEPRRRARGRSRGGACAPAPRACPAPRRPDAARGGGHAVRRHGARGCGGEEHPQAPPVLWGLGWIFVPIVVGRMLHADGLIPIVMFGSLAAAGNPRGF